MIPNDDMVIELTNALSENYYVKRVIEHPPRSGGRADHVQRYWDIAGRRYDGVYPIEFHMVLTGEEIHRGGIRPVAGTTKITIVVQGAYTNDEMKARIKGEWDALHDLTRDTMRSWRREGRRSMLRVLHSGRRITVRPGERTTVCPSLRATVRQGPALTRLVVGSWSVWASWTRRWSTGGYPWSSTRR